MNSLPLALALTLTLSLSAPFSPAAVRSAARTEAEARAAERAEAAASEEAARARIPTVPPSSAPGEPVAYDLRLPVLMYHHVVPNGESCNEMTVTVGRLERDLQWLADNGYHTVLPREMAAGQPLPDKPVLITFDDGYRSNYDLAYPLLLKYRAKAAIAIMVYMQDYWTGSFLSWDMCREMNASGLVEIGSHGYITHNLDARMGNFVPGQANGVQRKKGESDIDFQCRVLEDLRCSHQRIAIELGTAPTYFAYPFGKTDPDADAFVEALFPVTAVTGPGKRSANLSKGLHQLPRFTITMQHRPSEFLK